MRIGPYEVVSTLGQGGMGVVYRARSPEGRDVAVKVLLDVADDSLARLERERRLLGVFTARDGFVPLLDSGSSERGPYLVMPFVGGGTLKKRLESGPLGLDAAVALGIALAHAIGKAHARGIVHRDLKPDNVLFTAEGKPLIADLGLAKYVSRSDASRSALSGTGMMAGTPGYMAPEQLDDSKNVGPEADVFALGVIVFECLVGERPVEATGVVQYATAVASGRIRRLRDRRPDAPPWLDEVLAHALRAEPGDRLRDGLALEQALGRPGRRRSSRVAIGSALVLVVLGGGLSLVRPWARAGSPPPAPKEPAPARPGARALVEEAERKLRRDDVDGAILSASQAIAVDPACAPAWTCRGAALTRKETERADGAKGPPNLDAAIADFTRAIELDPKGTDALKKRAIARAAAHQEGELEDLTRVVELDPGTEASWLFRAEARHRKKDLAGAVEDYTRALELDPRDAPTWDKRGTVEAEQRDFARAVDDYTKAVEIDGSFMQAWTNRGTAWLSQGRFEEAIADYDRVIALDPRNADVLFGRGVARENRNDHAGAREDYARVVALGGQYATSARDRLAKLEGER
jgi:tetratricopeptide (TPR) repeat protein